MSENFNKLEAKDEPSGWPYYYGEAEIGTPTSVKRWKLKTKVKTDNVWLDGYPLRNGRPSNEPFFAWDDRAEEGMTYWQWSITTVPELTTVTIASNNVDTTEATIGDTIILTIEATADLQTPIITIGAWEATVVQGADKTLWTASRVMTIADIAGEVTFEITFNDFLGNPWVTVDAVTDASSVTFDKVIGTIVLATMASNNTDTTKAKTADIATLTFESSEDLKTKPTVTIAGHSIVGWNITQGIDASHWTAVYTMAWSDTEGLVTFTIDGLDLAGIPITQCSVLTGGVGVTFDKTVPVITDVRIASNNINDTTLAIVDDVVHVRVESTSLLKKPTFTIAGHAIDPSAVVIGDSAMIWTASYTMVIGDTEGSVPFTINGVDLAANPFVEVTATTNESIVTFDKTAPIFTLSTLVSDNADTAKAKEWNTISVDFISDEELIADPTVTFGTKTMTLVAKGPGIAPGTFEYEYDRILDGTETEGTANCLITGSDMAGNVTTNTNIGSIITDFTAPTLDSGTETNVTHLNIVLSELCLTASITKSNDGGFVVYETGTPGTTYVVSAIAPGIDNTHVVLTVADITASIGAGITVTYIAWGNGTVADLTGNLLATDAIGVEITLGA